MWGSSSNQSLSRSSDLRFSLNFSISKRLTLQFIIEIRKKSYDDLLANKCNDCGDEMNTVGYFSTKVSEEPVTYYLKTTASEPFCINDGTPMG